MKKKKVPLHTNTWMSHTELTLSKSTWTKNPGTNAWFHFYRNQGQAALVYTDRGHDSGYL